MTSHSAFLVYNSVILFILMTSRGLVMCRESLSEAILLSEMGTITDGLASDGPIAHFLVKWPEVLFG